ncbi:hypothetical protein [Dyadobacter psychrotolerans]|uniref:Uncharacterized protein n=1 Tax=Dyadobacter psychrotolerans TaxID=2541721 RepID=A0A4R5DX03_9BACT|nr:hypothetical protein [Dyadobacter psychrotolerans]TDE15593.1 hypothetical protein E0F88_13915 [Dyadobacter psychrotolerans]
MTLYSLALRIKEVRDLQKNYMQTMDSNTLTQLTDRETELDKLVTGITESYGGGTSNSRIIIN